PVEVQDDQMVLNRRVLGFIGRLALGRGVERGPAAPVALGVDAVFGPPEDPVGLLDAEGGRGHRAVLSSRSPACATDRGWTPRGRGLDVTWPGFEQI
ncbi:MAG: hypothetical protein B7Z54_09750, partial [Sphingobacteriales bacterium 12-47-4]